MTFSALRTRFYRFLMVAVKAQERVKVTADLRRAEAAAADAKRQLNTAQAESVALRQQLDALQTSVTAARDASEKANSERVASEKVPAQAQALNSRAQFARRK